MNYWKRTYGHKSNDFLEGVIAAMTTYAVWKDGKQYIGVMQEPLEKAIGEAITGLVPHGGKKEGLL